MFLMSCERGVRAKESLSGISHCSGAGDRRKLKVVGHELKCLWLVPSRGFAFIIGLSSIQPRGTDSEKDQTSGASLGYWTWL